VILKVRQAPSFINIDSEKLLFGTSLISSRRKKVERTSKVIVADYLIHQKSVEASEFKSHEKTLFLKGNGFDIIENTSFYFVQFIQNRVAYFYTESQSFKHGVNGYAGEINVGVLYNEDGEVVKVTHIDSQETESYLKQIANVEYYAQYQGLNLNSENVIDGVSGATITSRAIAETVTALSNHGKPFMPLSINQDRFIVKSELRL
jgi:hypothetical protein